ncbi:MAG: hypothetical protein HY235_16790 [Acidobacteria bacterium]|nr:hypothetical protein [Acidobacteriota bacterium]
MGKPTNHLDVECPCCQATLRVDPQTGAVLTYKAKDKPATFEDFGAAVKSYQGEAGRREQAFQKSMAEHKVHKEVLAKKFDELFKEAKEKPDEPPPLRDVDL